ncbi:Ribosomal protein L7/L12 (plasmid) [Gloeothece citriformis PCC 7424]|uniref:Ribosomal protein L7/L12 n=1 Tax=Gloeothece citriformis (strain PCC 7424) TaxID=65393 RepID=B7KN08_GLOC7|nr:ribosomal protein L7/L12 [Gloeothece citriformis]ACK74180.1 Ribosomal protein L7/L12 [Gloeothece citriformis PCC 7424]
MNKRLEQLLKKKEQLNAQIQKIKTRESAEKKKEDTRRKILLGALVMEMMDRKELDRDKIMKRLEGFLVRDIDRRLFDFSVEETVNEQASTSTTEEKPQTFEVIIDEVPTEHKIAILKAVRTVTGFELKEAKELVESAPKLLIKVENQSSAEGIKKQLEKAGARVSLKSIKA